MKAQLRAMTRAYDDDFIDKGVNPDDLRGIYACGLKSVQEKDRIRSLHDLTKDMRTYYDLAAKKHRRYLSKILDLFPDKNHIYLFDTPCDISGTKHYSKLRYYFIGFYLLLNGDLKSKTVEFTITYDLQEQYDKPVVVNIPVDFEKYFAAHPDLTEKLASSFGYQAIVNFF
jgi:hypothetical protein